MATARSPSSAAAPVAAGAGSPNAGDDDGSVEGPSAGNMKRTWVTDDNTPDWWDAGQGRGREFLRRATQVENIWVPYGE